MLRAHTGRSGMLAVMMVGLPGDLILWDSIHIWTTSDSGGPGIPEDALDVDVILRH